MGVGEQQNLPLAGVSSPLCGCCGPRGVNAADSRFLSTAGLRLEAPPMFSFLETSGSLAGTWESLSHLI